MRGYNDEREMEKRSMRRLLALTGILCASLTLALSIGSSKAQDAGSATESKSPATETVTDKKAEEPIDEKWDAVVDFRHTGLLFTDVSVDDSAETFNFLIDSGASTSILSLHTAKRLGLPMVDSPMPAQGVGQQEMKLVQGVSCTVAGYEFTPQAWGVIDMGHIGGIGARRLDGILGCDFLYEFKECRFDFEKSKLYLDKFAPGERKKTVQDLVGSINEVPKMMEKLKGGDPVELMELMLKILKEMRGEKPVEEEQPAKKPEPKEDKSSAEPERYGVEPSDERVFLMETIQRFIGEAARAQTATQPASKTSVPFRMIESQQFPLVGKLVLGTLMFCDIRVNGEDVPVLFDTGAGAMLVLDSNEARRIDAGSSVNITVSGVGSSTASMGVAKSLTVGDFKSEQEQPTVNMNLQALFQQLENPILQMVGVKDVGAKGILGLPFCMQYRAMTIDFKDSMVHFEPYDDGKRHEHSDLVAADRDYILTAIRNVWGGLAGSVDFEANAMEPLEVILRGLEGALIVTSVDPEGEAALVGLERGDLILGVESDGLDGNKTFVPPSGTDDLNMMAAYRGFGAVMRLKVKKKRSGETKVIELPTARFTGSVEIPAWYK